MYGVASDHLVLSIFFFSVQLRIYLLTMAGFIAINILNFKCFWFKVKHNTHTHIIDGVTGNEKECIEQPVKRAK